MFIYDVEENSEEVLEEKGERNCLSFGRKFTCCPVLQARIGAVKAGSRRPMSMKVVLQTADHAKQIIHKGKKLNDVVACRNIFVCPDQSVEERAWC